MNKETMDKTSLIFKVLSGEASVDELKELDEWIAQSESNRSENDDLKLLWNNRETGSDNTDHFYDGLNKIKARMRQKVRRKDLYRVTILIAVLAIGLIATLLYFYHGSTGYLRFDDAPLESVINILEKKYQIQIETEQKEVLTCRFTGTFYKVDKVQMVLKSLGGALDLDYEFLSDNKYRLNGGRCLGYR